MFEKILEDCPAMNCYQLFNLFLCFIVATDPCDSVTCGENESCVNGTCECSPGFLESGGVCERKFYKLYRNKNDFFFHKKAVIIVILIHCRIPVGLVN